MKQLIGVNQGGYVFNHTNRTVTITGISGIIKLEHLYAIVNTNTNKIIYQPNKVGYGAILNGYVFTLDYDTTSMNSSDSLMIIIDIDKQPYPFSDSQDSYTKAINTVDYAHHEIHSGSHFMYNDCIELDNTAIQDYLITTPNTTKRSHMSFNLEGSAITSFDVYEASDKVGTTLQTIYNNNRNSSNISGNTIHKGVTGGTTDGIEIWCHKGGSATNQSITSVSTQQSSEIVLKQNTKYILRVVSFTNDNLINIKLSWYEHTNS